MTTCNEGELDHFIVDGDIIREQPSDPLPVLRSVRFQYSEDVFEISDDFTVKVNGLLSSPVYGSEDDPVHIKYVPPNIVSTTDDRSAQTFGHVLEP